MLISTSIITYLLHLLWKLSTTETWCYINVIRSYMWTEMSNENSANMRTWLFELGYAPVEEHNHILFDSHNHFHSNMRTCVMNQFVTHNKPGSSMSNFILPFFVAFNRNSRDNRSNGKHCFITHFIYLYLDYCTPENYGLFHLEFLDCVLIRNMTNSGFFFGWGLLINYIYEKFDGLYPSHVVSLAELITTS